VFLSSINCTAIICLLTIFLFSFPLATDTDIEYTNNDQSEANCVEPCDFLRISNIEKDDHKEQCRASILGEYEADIDIAVPAKKRCVQKGYRNWEYKCGLNEGLDKLSKREEAFLVVVGGVFGAEVRHGCVALEDVGDPGEAVIAEEEDGGCNALRVKGLNALFVTDKGKNEVAHAEEYGAA